LFHKESVKVEVCKTVIEGLSAQNGPITDPIIINALMFIARIMHDSVRYVNLISQFSIFKIYPSKIKQINAVL